MLKGLRNTPAWIQLHTALFVSLFKQDSSKVNIYFFYLKVWDNVGLLVEPRGSLFVRKILITNDLTEPVLNEAIEKEG